MNKYIFYTTEGYTTAPNELVGVENCQLLGQTYGNTAKEASENLLKENSWITEAGFAPSEFIVEQLLTDEQRTSIKSVIQYLYKNAMCHSVEKKDTVNHILKDIKNLQGI